MQGIYDFLIFRLFVSPYLLVAFYYVGAIGVPVGGWIFSDWVRRKYRLVSEAHESVKAAILKTTRRRDRLLFAMLFISIFIFLEIIWRMMFEFLIAYLQMRNALLELTSR